MITFIQVDGEAFSGGKAVARGYLSYR